VINPKIAISGEILKEDYLLSSPYPSIVLSDFLDHTVLSMCEYEARGLSDNMNSEKWRFNESDAHEDQVLKYGISNVEHMTPMLYAVSHYMNSPVFIEFLRKLTGIEDLIGDPMLVGGGLHITKKGGKLSIHHDFTDHTIDGVEYKRHVNLLIYLNKDWRQEWGGNLELWSPDLSKMIKKLPIKFNNAVIFNIDNAPHGHPNPLACPPGESRRSLAFYYYSKEKTVHDFKRAWWLGSNGDYT